MTDIIRRDTDYAMRALVYLALNTEGAPVPARVLAKSLDIPAAFAYKILRKLTLAGITAGHMGTAGGFVLNQSAEEITLLQVISAIQGPLIVKKCCMDVKACPRQPTCDISIKLRRLQDALADSLSKMTLADLLKENRTG